MRKHNSVNNLYKRTQLLLKKLGVAGVVVIATLTLGACQQKQAETSANPTRDTENKSETSSQTKSKKRLSPPDADDWIATDEQIWIPVLNETGQHLKIARENFLKKDNKQAANGIKMAVNNLKQEIPKATKEQQEKIKKANENLEKLANEVEKGNINSVKELDRVFVEAYQADINNTWLVIEEQQKFSVYTEISKHWQKAEKFFQNNKQAAASEIRKGAVFMGLEANRSSGKNRSALESATEELEKIAEKVQKNKITDVQTLNNAFAKGNLALAKFYIHQATQADSAGEVQKTGYELRGAARHLGEAAKWLGEEKGEISATEKEAQEVAQKLIEGNKEEAKTFKDAIDAVSKETDRLSGQVK